MDNFGHAQPWGHHPPLFDPSIIARLHPVSTIVTLCYTVKMVDAWVDACYSYDMPKQVHPAVKALEEAYELLQKSIASEFLLLQVANARDLALAELDTDDE